MKAHERKHRGAAGSNAGGAALFSGGPEWCWGEGALESSAEKLRGMPGPFLLMGEPHLLSPARKRISGAWIEEGIEIQPLSFAEGAECSESLAKAMAAAAASKKSGSLIAWGGGKCIDTVKWAGLLAGLPVVTVPTSAATCACASSVVVAHSPAGEVLEIIDLPAAPKLCIADFELLRSAPLRLLKAGQADTLAKWLEWQAVEEPEGPGAGEARAAYEASMDPSADEERLWDASLRLSAEASRLGGAPAAAAHSFCAGMSLLEKSAAWLHGEWVGLGLLFQCRLLGQDSGALEAWLGSQGLMTCLPFGLDDGELARVAGKILAPEESIWLLEGQMGLGPQAVRDALLSLRGRQ